METNNTTTTTTYKFLVMPDGDDARAAFGTNDYQAARKDMIRRSVGHWLGFKVMGPSGRIMAAYEGQEIGHLDGEGRWIETLSKEEAAGAVHGRSGAEGWR